MDLVRDTSSKKQKQQQQKQKQNKNKTKTNKTKKTPQNIGLHSSKITAIIGLTIFLSHDMYSACVVKEIDLSLRHFLDKKISNLFIVNNDTTVKIITKGQLTLRVP